jgi:polar amino acid transport system substrate-binding protein
MDRQAVLVAGTVAPYADNALPAGGMITDLISQALESAVPDWPYTVGFRGDWSPSAPTLHLDEAFDIGFPSIKPDCAPDAFMSARIRQVCEIYEFSRPILLAEVAYYGRNGDPVLQGTSAIDLSGQRVCTGDERPETERNPLNTAAAYGPAEPAPALERCFEQLAGGKTDVVVGLKATGDATIDMLGLDGAVSEIEGLRSEQTLHAFAPKGNAYALEVLKSLDQGIGDLMISGRWFEIVSSHETNRVAFLAR